MKKFLMVSAAVIACAAAAPAFAASSHPGPGDESAATSHHGADAVANFEVEGDNPAKCGVKVNTTGSAGGDYAEVELGSDDITTTDGFVNPSLATTIAGKMNGKATAWCTGNKNKINLTRSALWTGNGNSTSNGFAKAVLYDLNVDIATSSRVGGGAVMEGSSDGEGLGPDITSFGPTGNGVPLAFSVEPGSQVIPVTTALAGTLKSGDFTTMPSTRLAAGFYEGWVQVTITPGY